MSNQYNDQIADRIMDETEKNHFIRKEDELDYAHKWYMAFLESEQGDIFKVKPPVYSMTPMTDEQLQQAEDKFINSFSK